MKTTLRMLIGMTTLLWFGTAAFGQLDVPKVAQSTKIAMVNMNRVFKEHSDTRGFDKMIIETVKPYQEKADKLRGLPYYGRGYRIRKERHELEKDVRELEMLHIEVNKLVHAKYAKEIAELRMEMDMGVKVCAEFGGYQIVLDYGGPIVPVRFVDPPDDQARSLAVVKNGAVAAVYVHASVDITDWVIRTLRPAPAQIRPE